MLLIMMILTLLQAAEYIRGTLALTSNVIPDYSFSLMLNIEVLPQYCYGRRYDSQLNT